MTSSPPDAVAAVTHPDPYPFYADLVRTRPLYRDAGLGLWVASSAAAVTAVLSSALGRVRPPPEPVPKAIVGSRAGDLFGRLVRMNDGPGQVAHKQSVTATLAPIDAARVGRLGRERARALLDEIPPRDDFGHVTDFAFRLPVDVVGCLLGIPVDRLPQTAEWIGDYVSCLAAGADAGAIARGAAAADRLLARGAALLAEQRARPAGGLFAELAARGGAGAADAVVANGIGLLSQAYEATAGLIGNTLLALARRPDVRGEIVARPERLPDLVGEIARFDPPIQNTRRFVGAAGTVGGHRMDEGDAILVVLAAANRDPAANPDPDRLVLARPDRKSFTFSAGAHACPGETMAVAIASAGVAELLETRLDVERLAEHMTYRASVNARIPLFG